MVKVVTSNILFEMEQWAQRRELLVEGLAAKQADLIGGGQAPRRQQRVASTAA